MVVNEQVSICAGCDKIIQDRYLFQVTNRKWHCNCLRCTHCNCQLNDKCWVKQNNLYCKEDYYRVFFSCNNCKQVIERDSFVRKTSNLIFHLRCFQCSQCGKVLDSGDHYLLQGSKLICSNHYPNFVTLNNSKNSSTEIATETEGEIVVKTEQSLDNPPFTGHFFDQFPFASTNSITNNSTNTITHSHSPYLPNRQTPASANSNRLLHSSTDHHHSNTVERLHLLPQSLSLIDYSSHQPTSLIEKANDFDSDFFSTQSCYIPYSESTLPAPNSNILNNTYEQDAVRFYNSSCVTIGSMSNSVTTQLHCSSPLNEIENTGSSLSNNLSNNNARKGRPRKRKQLALSANRSSNTAGIDAISTALHEQNLNNLNSSTSSTNSQNLANKINSSSSTEHLQNSNSSNSSSSSITINHQRTKRMRTSFKHNQLKLMKSYFSHNQNPDAKDLKGLSQETSLSKRVLQVWFQNARAKWRRSNSKGDSYNQKNLNLNSQISLGSPDNGSTRQYFTPSPASIISNNSISNSNNQSTNAGCLAISNNQNQLSLPSNSINNLCTNASNSSLDQYSPSNSISLLRQTPPPSVKMPSSPHLPQSNLHFGHHLTTHSKSLIGNLSSNLLPDRPMSNFNSEQVISTFQELY